jgi:bifunctional pyridoxal-dependent enzyme with beta-cystathionase and maltose regulon repressor activities
MKSVTIDAVFEDDKDELEFRREMDALGIPTICEDMNNVVDVSLFYDDENKDVVKQFVIEWYSQQWGGKSEKAKLKYAMETIEELCPEILD